MSALGYEPIHKLRAEDSVASFDCGYSALNQFLHRYAFLNQKAGSAQTYACCKAGEVAGFYSLTVGSVEHTEAPDRVVKGLARHPLPVIILARLGVDISHQRKVLGLALLKDALLRTIQVADIVGIRALIVHSKNDVARKWYTEWEFEPSPTDPFHLFLMLKDLKAIAGKN